MASTLSITDTTDGPMQAVTGYWEWYMKHTIVPGREFASQGYFDAIKADHERAYSSPNEALDMPGLKGKSVLELGCGIGLDTVELVRHGAEVTAIDNSTMALDMAGMNLAFNGFEARLERENAEALSYESNSFDQVLSRGILMFTPDDNKIVDEIHRVLKTGGQAQALLHNRNSWYVAMAKAAGTNLVHEGGDPPINRLYSVAKAKAMFREFSDVKIVMGRFPFASRRKGIFAQVFNNIVVPISKMLPKPLVRPFGYYIIVKAVK